MNTTITPAINNIIEAVHYSPSVSVIIPFEPKMNAKASLSHSLKLAATRVKKEMAENYPGELAGLVMQKLETIIKNLNYNTHKKSIAIYVSPIFEKVLYLDLAVEEKIIVDESFEIRDLVYCKKQAHKFLILLLSARESKMYLNDSDTPIHILSNTLQSAYTDSGEAPERVGNFSTIPERKELLMEKFLHHVDQSLDIILNAYRLPLFILGTKRIMGHFKSISRHKNAVLEYIHGNYEEASTKELQTILEPFIADWEKIEKKNLLNKLEEAADKKKLVFGIRDVWQEAKNQKGQLLIVEKDYIYPAKADKIEEVMDMIEPYNNFSHIKDAVDDIIEKVLENGGDVEFTEAGALREFQQIALIKYY